MKRPVLFGSLLALLILSVAASAAPGDTIYAHPGRLVSAGDGARLNFNCMGAGSPAVVFESAFADWAPAWAVVLPRIAVWTRACVYDHAGAGFSDPGPMPRTNVRIANELHQALHNAGIAGPYILVGNASGGDPARTFAQLYMAETAGLVLVEVDSSDLEPKALQDEDHAGNARGIAELRKCRDAVATGGHCRPGPHTRIGLAPSVSSFAGSPNQSFRLN
jgi:pimeloyl-ACP methyl ester carboxylesterase